MMRYFRALWYFVTGRFSAAADALQSNKYVMQATYDAAISRGADRFTTVRDAVAKLMSIEQTRVEEIKKLGVDAERLNKVKSGAQVASQRRINDLRSQGKAKEEIVQDPAFLKHQAAFKDASSSLEHLEERIADKEKDLKERQEQIAQYKIELQRMQRQQQTLKEEKHEALADVAIAQQMQGVNDVLAGIAEDRTDKDLAAVRDARQAAKAKARISAELTGNDAQRAESEYLNLAAKTEADRELDALLDWGDEAKPELKDAKIPE
jgi:hypothetical protein